jgi:hypothetical protein
MQLRVKGKLIFRIAEISGRELKGVNNFKAAELLKL